jgi:hypothetical protein
MAAGIAANESAKFADFSSVTARLIVIVVNHFRPILDRETFFGFRGAANSGIELSDDLGRDRDVPPVSWKSQI